MDAIELNPIWDPFLRSRLPSRSKNESKQDSRQSSLFLSAGLTACFTSSLYNSLDCLRVRWQVQNGPPTQYATISLFARNIVKTEGFWKGLWQPGIGSNALGMGTSAAIRFGYYETIRDSLYDKDESSKNGIHMILAGSIVGSIAYFITTPFHLIKTLSQAEVAATMPNGVYLYGPRAGMKPYITSLRSGLVQLVSDQGYLGLYRGWLPLTIRGAMFTSGQMLGYDGCKTFCKSHDMQDGPLLHTLSSIAAALGATILSTPPDYVMARYMSNSNFPLSSIVEQIYQEHGILGFWKGSSISFFRVTPVMLTWSIVYEQLRYHLGIGYMS